MPAIAHAGDNDDTVFLKNGGRIRGTVLVEDPGKGVTIKLADGTSRTLAPAEVKNVEYGGAAAAPAAAPTPAPVASAPAPAPAAAAPAPAAPAPAALPISATPAQPAEPHYHRRMGLLITGIVVMGAGAVAAGVGAGLAVSAEGHGNSCNGSGSGGCTDESTQAAGIGLAVLGGVALAAGAPFLILGMIKKPDDPRAESGKITLVPGRVALTPVATNNTWGLQLSGNL